MDQNRSKPEDQPFSWQSYLNSETTDRRLKALEYLAGLARSDELMVRALEKVALRDPSEEVRQKAEEVLLAYPHQPIYR